MNTKSWLVKIVIVLALLSIVAACSPQGASMSQQEIESMLMAKEQEKWDKFFQGKYSEVSHLYADDFINISPSPAGTFRQNKQETDAALSQLPPMPGEYSVTDFLFVHPDPQTAVVSYKVTAFFGAEYATAVWALRNGEWTTVFYQASPIPSAEGNSAPVETAVSIDPMVLLLFPGRYIAESASINAVLFNAIGTYAVDAGATGQYGTTGTFKIEGARITFTDDERTDVPVCSGDERTGTYQFTFDGSTLTFTNVDDKCVGRSSYFTSGRVWKK